LGWARWVIYWINRSYSWWVEHHHRVLRAWWDWTFGSHSLAKTCFNTCKSTSTVVYQLIHDDFTWIASNDFPIELFEGTQHAAGIV
jgi:hypothetical protein